MRYMLLANTDPAIMPAAGTPEWERVMGDFMAFTQALAESGVMLAGEVLHDGDTATTVRVRGDDVLLTDGPFADVTEVFGGYWIVEAPDLDTALKHARACPAAAMGSVEVRAVADRPS